MFNSLRCAGNSDATCNKMLAQLKKKFANLNDTNYEITPKDLCKFIIYLMQLVEKHNTAGSAKKDLVITILKNVVNDNKKNIKNVECIENFLSTILPSLIDVIISLDRKETFIKLENTFTNFGCM